MSIHFEIAYALASKRLALFLGTGFSKCITNNSAPDWAGLLIECCDELSSGSDKLKNELFPSGNAILSLEECAQIIDLKLRAEGKDINTLIAERLKGLSIGSGIDFILSFFQEHSFRVVTTNYDKLVENELAPGRCVSVSPGMPIPKVTSPIKVFHIHGSVDHPAKMVVTSENYFDFLNKPSYFSNKWHTTLYENTIVIIGYSLADTNLKTIINDYRKNSTTTYQSNNLIFVSRNSVEQSVKDYYAHCYGMRVIDNADINNLFNLINWHYHNETINKVEESQANIDLVLNHGRTFTGSYLKLRNSFFEILSAISAIGFQVHDPRVISLIRTIIEKKVSFTHENSAWEQYDHLSEWLVYLGSILDLHDQPILDQYLEAVKHSMSTMSKRLLIGYSWQSYKSWKSGWTGLTPKNRELIKNKIQTELYSADAIDVISQ